MTQQYHAVKSEELQKQMAEDKQGGGDSAWLKLAEGTHTLRICPPFAEDGVPYRKAEIFQNLTGQDGKKIHPLSFDFFFSNGRLAKYLVQQKKVTKIDFDLWKKHGDPLKKLAEAVSTLGDKSEGAKKLWPSKKFFFNVVNRQDGKVYKMQQSKKFFEAVEAQFKMSPNLFDPNTGFDFMITATGSGFQRRYSAPIFIQNPTPLNTQGTLHNLDDVLANSVYGYHVVLEAMASTVALQPFIQATRFDIRSFLQ